MIRKKMLFIQSLYTLFLQHVAVILDIPCNALVSHHGYGKHTVPYWAAS
jgi:hypothetical protein